MPGFQLLFAMSRSETPRSLILNCTDPDTLAEAARSSLAVELDHPGELVTLDLQKGRFTIGAGFWSRSGYFRIEHMPDPKEPARTRR